MADINVNIKPDGEIVISIIHRDNSTDIDQQALGVFLQRAFKDGIQICKIGGYMDIGNPAASRDNYEIKIKK